MQAIVERRVEFDAFYRSQREVVLRAVSFALNERDLAVECLDEAMVRAYEHWGEVGDMANPTGWVFRVAEPGPEQVVTAGSGAGAATTSPPGPDDIDAVADPGIAKALAELPIDQRTVVVLRFYLDWSLDQIAEALGDPVGTVKSRLHRGLRRLQTKLEEPA